MNRDHEEATPGPALKMALSDIAIALRETDKSAAQIAADTGVSAKAINRLVDTYFAMNITDAYYPSSKTIEKLSAYVNKDITLSNKRRI